MHDGLASNRVSFQNICFYFRERMQNGGRKAGPSGSRWVGAGPSGPFRVVWATVLFILVGM